MKEYLDAARETVEYMNAITRMNHLSEDPFDHAKIINLGATAWAYGITPEMMEVFGRIAATMRITAEDIRQLERHGIENRVTRKPWLDAKNGEAWVIDVDGYPEPLAVIVDDTRFETHLAAINKTDPRITAGRRIWPEAGDDQ